MFWHLINLETDGCVAQTGLPGSYFIVSPVSGTTRRYQCNLFFRLNVESDTYHITSVSLFQAQLLKFLFLYKCQTVLGTHKPPTPTFILNCFSSFVFFFVFLCRAILPMSSRSVLNHSQQVGGPTGQTGGMGGGGERGGSGTGRSGSMGSPSRSSPSIIGMPKQQQARQPFTINR